ncbi:MAG: hypothetical protein ACM3Q4_05180 [Acidobacteriota bacterium]
MTPLTNFSHLHALTEKIPFEGESVSIVHAHATAPAYKWVDAKESEADGIAGVEDAARAAVVLLRHYELTKDDSSLRRARPLCEFVMKMQAEDGRFYNFIFADHTINRTGKNSYKSFGWWASRAIVCLSTAYRILKEKDHSFAERCRKAIVRSLPHVDSALAPYNRMTVKKGFRMPEYLLYQTGADVSSELMLGLIEFARASGDERIRTQIRKMGEGLVLMQEGDWRKFPHALHRSWETTWRARGNSQTQALASAALYLDEKDFLRSAVLEANAFYSRLIIHGMMKEMDVTKPDNKRDYEQTASGIRPMALGLIRIFEATDDTMYLKMAALASSWLFGNNSAEEQMYDPKTGRCFDGITAKGVLNKNSGAESTIEALAVIVELSRYPGFRKYLHYRRIDSYSVGSDRIAVFRHTDGNAGVFVMDIEKKTLQFLEGKNADAFVRKHPELVA